MLITSVNKINQNKNNYKKASFKNVSEPVNIAFGNNVSVPNALLTRTIEKCYKKTQSVQKTMKNLLFNTKAKNVISDSFYTKLDSIDERSPDFIRFLSAFGKKLGRSREVEINLESNRILDIVNSDEACIFIMNHDNKNQDTAMLSIFNTFLSDEYIKVGKASTCPRPRFIINEDTLSSMSPYLRKVFEKLGAVGIDSSILTPDASNNTKKMFPIMRAFNRDKVNIFIFPEGSLRVLKGLDIEYKFQTGVAEMVNAVVGTKKSVKVVPIGFAYNEKSKQFLGSIHIGEPIYFRRHGKNIEFSNGNIGSEFTSQHYLDFFDINRAEHEFNPITSQGQPITGKNLGDYIAGVLCENLKICKEEAKKQLPQKSLGDTIIKT